MARGASEAPTSRLVRAVGPTDRRADELKSTATNAGNRAAYTPVTSGMPAKAAYATPCGMTISATVRPAATSLARSARLGRGQARKGSQRRRRARVRAMAGRRRSGGLAPADDTKAAAE